jgi:hypothetical protein
VALLRDRVQSALLDEVHELCQNEVKAAILKASREG